jgi:hypothetical protein
MTLADHWRAYAADLPAGIDQETLVRIRRGFYAGCSSTLSMAASGVKRAEFLQELAFYGRQVGTPHESRC